MLFGRLCGRAARVSRQHLCEATPCQAHMADPKHNLNFQYEFMGPYGPALIVTSLPLVVLGLTYACNVNGCLQLFPHFYVPGFPADAQLYTHEAMLAVVGWFTLVLALHLLLPGQTAQGSELPNKRRLTYKLNAFSVFLITYGTTALLSFGLAVLDISWIATNFLPLATASITLSSVLAVIVYVCSFRQGALLAHGGNSGVMVYDFWMGRELNPRFFGIDVKEFCELYPGIIGWALLNLAFAYQQYLKLGYITNSMLLVNAFELWYIVDALYNEKAILTTMDITTDGFGFMLSFGNLCWVPFTFSTQARYLADWPKQLSSLSLVGVLSVKALGYYIFRGANGQKNTFRRDSKHPSVAHLTTMPTERGTQLIISGWWGAARHINYLGDWIMGLAWCLPCGVQGMLSIVPYFYCIYFAILLIHRERRDEACCRIKYGRDWDKYCKLVPWRIIPYVY